MRLALAVLAVPLLLAAADRDRAPAATPAGPAVSCLGLAQIRETRVRDDRTIDFVTRGGKVYRNTLPYACPELGFEQRFAYATSLSQLCSVNIITVLRESPVSSGASCGLGQFHPVKLTKR